MKKKSLKRKDLTQEELGEVEGELQEVQDDLAEDVADTEGEKALEPHEQQGLTEAHGFLKELGETQDFSDEHRYKAYHYHKTLDAMAQINDMAESQDIPPQKSMPGDEQWQQEEMNEPEHKSCRKACGEVSQFFKGLTTERAFGDVHREKAMHYHKALSPFVEMDAADDVENVQEGGEMAGEMGEKLLQEIAQQQKSMEEFNRKLQLFSA